MPVTVLIVDDHPSFRRVLRSVLVDVPDIEIAGEASNGKEAIEKARELKPDVAIMDLRMPEINGVKATAAIAESVPNTRILILTLFDEADDMFSAYKAGARGYLLKSAELDGLIAAIKTVAADRVIVTPTMASRLLLEFKPGKKQPGGADTLKLTHEEKQVLQLVAQGLRTDEIKTQLSASEDDIQSALRQVLGKLQAKYQGKAG